MDVGVRVTVEVPVGETDQVNVGVGVYVTVGVCVAVRVIVGVIVHVIAAGNDGLAQEYTAPINPSEPALVPVPPRPADTSAVPANAYMLE